MPKGTKSTGASAAPKKTTRFAAIDKWQIAKEALAIAQAAERDARMAVGALFFAERIASQKEGSISAEVEGVWKLTWKQPYNYTVDEAVLDSVKKELTDNGVDPNKLFRYKPSLNMEAYRKADETTLLILAQAVQAKPGMPQLEIKHAKEKGDKGEKAGRKGAA